MELALDDFFESFGLDEFELDFDIDSVFGIESVGSSTSPDTKIMDAVDVENLKADEREKEKTTAATAAQSVSYIIDASAQRKRKRRSPHNARSNNPLKAAKAINLSRAKSTQLVVFPAYDKCDSLVFFPSAMTRFINSGDFPSFRKLLNTHFDRNCLISYKGVPVTPTMVLKRFQLTNELHPDLVMCVFQSRVVDDRIEATIFSKWTDCPALYDAVARQIKGTTEHDYLLGPRSEHLKKKMNLEARNKVDRFRLTSLIDSGLELTVHGTLSLSLRFDTRTRKVISMDYRFDDLTSVQPADISAASMMSSL